MRIFRLILVLVVALTTGAQIWQERRRLDVIKRLPGRQARDHYEATRARDERLMLIVTAVLTLAAAAALVVVATRGRGP
jgi:uncharacterized iron-regulated membrane protein